MTIHRGQTDRVTKIELPSAIDLVAWRSHLASPGGKARLDVFTSCVGNGAPLEIELSDNSGKKADFSTRISGNHLWADFTVPLDSREALVATVKLPKHGLVMKSAPLPIAPSVQISNARWDKTEVRRGESVKLTADVKGVPDGVELLIEIFEYDANGAHELVTKLTTPTKNRKIETEWEYQRCGDTNDIPAAYEAEKGYEFPEYFFRVTIAGISADSGRLRFKDWLEIELHDRRGNPMGGVHYVLHFADGSQRKGILSAEGTAVEHGIPPGPFKVDFPDINGPVAVAEDEG